MTLQEVDALLKNITISLKTFSETFNNASQEVTKNIEMDLYYEGKSFDELRTELNSLMSDANNLKEIGKNININDKGQIDNYINKVKELDKTLSNMSTDININIEALNDAFEKEFKAEDGGTGKLKEQLNTVVRDLTESYTLSELKKFAPAIGKFAENFKTQVDQIEYQMGLLTQYGKVRSETAKALGFTIKENDIIDIKEAKKEELSELERHAIDDLSYESLEKAKLKESDIREKSESIELYLKQLDASVGKHLKGYIDMYNDAYNLLQAGKVKQGMVNIVTSSTERSRYEELAGGTINWDKITNKDLEELDEKDTIKLSPEAEELIKSTPKVKANFEDIQKVISDTTKVTKDYGTELQKIVSEASVLSETQKKDLLGADYSEEIKKYKTNIQDLQENFRLLGKTSLQDNPGAKLDLANPLEAQRLAAYKSRIAEAIESIDTLKTQQAELFNNLKDPEKAIKIYDIGVNARSLLDEAKHVLESGYKVNLLDGSADKEKLDQLKEGFNQLLNNFKEYKIDIIPDSEIENLAKINALQDKIKSETYIQEKQAKAQADYENNKAKYLERQNKILQLQVNIKALTNTRDKLLSNASSVKNIEAKRVVLDKNGNPVREAIGYRKNEDGFVYKDKTEKYITSEKELITDRYTKAIDNANKAIASAKSDIDRLTNEFNKYNLEIPVTTPVENMRPNFTGQIKKDYMGVLRANRDEILGDAGLGKYDSDLNQLSEEAKELGINIDKSNSKIQTVGNTIKNVFNSGDIDKARQLLPVYGDEVDSLRDKINGQAKAQEIAVNRQKSSIKSLFEETKNYVSKQEAIDNKPMSYVDQVDYYDQQLSKFENGTKEYIEVLKLKNQAEAKAADETQKAADNQARFGDEIYKAKFEHTRNYVADQETFTGQKMPLQDQLEYYKSAIKQFESDSNEYVAILRLQRNIERQIEAQDQTDKKAALDNEVKIAEERVRAEEEAYNNRQKAYDKYNKQRQADEQTIDSIKNQFGERESLISGIDAPGLDKAIDKIRILKTELNKALEVGNANRASAIWDAYISATDKVIGKSREVEEAQKRQADAEKANQEAIKRLFEETKNYVSTQEALNNQPMPYADQAAYYTEQLAKFEEGTREYIEVLKLKNQAEAKAAEETKKAAKEEEEAQLEAVKAAKQRVTSILNTIKSFADGINSAVNKIVGIIRNGIAIINNIISSAAKIVTTIGNGIKSIITLFGNLGNRVKTSLLGVSEGSNTVNGSFNILKGSATELRSKLLLLKGAFDSLFNNEMIKSAQNLMASVYSLQNIAGPQVTQDVLDWANSMEYAFGLSAKDLIGDINELTGVLYGLGMNAKDTALGSENILMMSRYLAFMGAAGGDVNEVMTKLVSGMKGMTQAIDDLGLSVRDAQMDSFLKDLKAQGGEFAGIATDFSSLNEQARVYVRYASIIDQFTKNYDITNFADALTTVTGRLTILRQSVDSLMTTLGVGFTKVLAKLATYIIPVIRLIEQLVTRIFAFFGIDVTMTTDINEGTAALSGLSDGLDGTKEKLDEVGESAKKAGGNLQSFDRINNVTSSKGSGSGSKGDDDFDYSKLMNSMLEDLNDLASKATVSYSDKLLENLKAKLSEMKQEFLKFAKDITGREDFDLGFDWGKIKENLKTIRDNIIYTIKSWGSFIVEIGLKIADDINIGLIITKLTELLAKISEVAKALTDVLIPAFREFYDIALSKVVIYIGEQVVKAIDFTIEELDKWKVWLDENKDGIIGFFTDLANAASTAFDNIKPILDANWKSIAEAISNANEELRKFLGNSISDDGKKETIDNTISLWGELLQILASLASIGSNVLDIVIQLVKAFGEFATEELIPWINEKLKDLSDWLNENKDKIVDLIEKIGSATWEGFKTFVDLLGKLIDYVVQNPDSVFNFFKALIGLKVASWFTSTAASIGLALMGLKEITSFASGAGGVLSGLFGGGAAAGAVSGATEAAGAVGAAGAEAAGAAGAAGGAAAASGVALGPILLVTAAVVALIAAIKDLWDTSESFRQAIKDIWGNIVESFDNAKEKISEAFGNIKEAWDNFYKAYESSGLKSIIEFLVTLIAEYLGGAISGVITLIGNLFATIGNVLADIINIIAGVMDAFSGLIKLIGGVFELIFLGDADLIKQGWSELVTGLVEIVQGLLQGIIDIVGGSIGWFIDIGNALVGGLGQGISDAWQGFIESARSLFDGWIKSVKEFFGIHSPSTVFAEIGGYLVEGLWKGIQDIWDTFSANVIDIFNSLVSDIKGTFSDIGNFFSTTFNNAKELALSAWSNAKEKFTEIKNKVLSAFDGLKTEISITFTTVKENAISVWNDAKSRFTNVASNIAAGLGTIRTKAAEIFTNIKNDAINKLNSIGQSLSNAWNSATTTISNGWKTVTSNTKASTGRKITSHAVGGSIAGGQLFIANENGSAELIGNIDGSGKTNVANNNMIMQAMESGIFEAVYNAMAEVRNQGGGVGSNGNTNIRIDGFGLIDASTLKELARILAPYTNSNNINIADTGFSI